MYTLPEPALILLIGPAGAGKSTFAKRFFRDFEVLRSDHFRELLSNSENILEVSADARALYMTIAEKRLARRLTTVIDATNVDAQQRTIFLEMAKKSGVHTVGLVFALPEEECLLRNRLRSFRTVKEEDLRMQLQKTMETCKLIGEEGFTDIEIFRSQEDVNAYEMERPAATYGAKYSGVPFDIIGDIHGSLANIIAILKNLGYVLTTEGEAEKLIYTLSHPEARKVIFLDTIEEQCRVVPELERFVRQLVAQGIASIAKL